MSDVVPLRRADPVVGLAEAVEAFLAERDLAKTSHRVYKLTLEALSADLGPDVDVARVTRSELSAFLLRRHDGAAPKTWNRVVATLGSFFAYCVRQEWVTRSPATGLERRKERLGRSQANRTKAIAVDELEAFLARPDHALRERLLWRMLYETAARAQEVLLLDVEDLDLPNRRAVVIGKGGDAELVGWETATARLLPRYLVKRTAGPLFLASLASAPARQPAGPDVDVASGRGRLSYRRAAHLFAVATEGRWTLHQLRHSRLTHLAESGIEVPMLMAKSRHASIRTLSLYAKPTFDAMAAATARLDPAGRRRRAR